MNIKINKYSGCNLNGHRLVFKTVCYKFEYEEDKRILDIILARGYDLAAKVNPATANYGDMNRLPERIKRNCVAGILAEYCWKHFINKRAKSEIVLETEFSGASKQIDLTTKNTNKKIEVRSSFPRNGIEFALFNHKFQFDVLGPYFNTVKPQEIQKDYYVRTLYPYDSKCIFQCINTSIEVFLTGGATWGMMFDPRISKIKNLIPDDEIIDHARKSMYKVVPLSLACDTISIVDMIIKEGIKGDIGL